jgi:hypothetical protein
MPARAKTVLIGSLMVLGPHVALAQTDAVANVQKRVLTLAGARLVANAAETEAKRLNTTGAVAVVDDGGNLLYLHARRFDHVRHRRHDGRRQDDGS